MATFSFPDHWTGFLDRHGVHGACFELPETADAEGLGADLQLLSPAQAREEAEDCYPGLAVAADGYVPVGMCLAGSGDPYFIRSGEGPGGALYRIHHDALSWGDDGVVGYDAGAIAVVLGDYEALLPFRVG